MIVNDIDTAKNTLYRAASGRSRVIHLRDVSEGLKLRADEPDCQLYTDLARIANKIDLEELEVEELSVALREGLAAIESKAAPVPLMSFLWGSLVDRLGLDRDSALAARALADGGARRLAVSGSILLGFKGVERFVCVDLSEPGRVRITSVRWHPRTGYRFNGFSGRRADIENLIGIASVV